MKVVKILEIGRDLLKFMSDNGLRRDDYLFIGMYHEYEYRRRMHEKYAVMIEELADKYKVSETTVKRLIRRLSREV
jgi:DNA-binding MarR family transcriptional regulator